MALPNWVTDKNLGAFKSQAEKLETYLTLQDIDAKMDRFEEAYIQKLAALAKTNAAGRYLPDEVKDVLRVVCDLAPYADQLPEGKRAEFLKMAGRVLTTVCTIFGVE